MIERLLAAPAAGPARGRVARDPRRPARRSGSALPPLHVRQPIVPDRDRAPRGRARRRARSSAATAGSPGARSRSACSGSRSATSRRARASTHLDQVVVWSALIGRDAPLRDAARLRCDGRHLLRAQRRREHRPRGDDALGRVLRHPRRRQAQLVGARAALRRRSPAPASRSSTPSSRSTCAPTRSSAASAINFLALGITGYLFIDIYGGEGTPPDIPGIPDVHLGFLEDWYFIGPVLGQLNLMIWLAFADDRRHLGRALQDADRPADPRRRRAPARRRHGRDLGLQDPLRGRRALRRPRRARRRVSLDRVRQLVQPEHDRRDAASSRSRRSSSATGDPWGAAAAALLFGFSSALAQQLPAYSESAAVLFQALPYVLTLIAVAGVIGRSIPPAAVGRPYKKQ